MAPSSRGRRRSAQSLTGILHSVTRVMDRGKDSSSNGQCHGSWLFIAASVNSSPALGVGTSALRLWQVSRTLSVGGAYYFHSPSSSSPSSTCGFYAAVQSWPLRLPLQVPVQPAVPLMNITRRQGKKKKHLGEAFCHA
jgi:hypothetical protein